MARRFQLRRMQAQQSMILQFRQYHTPFLAMIRQHESNKHLKNTFSMIVGVRFANLRPPTIPIIAQSRRFVILPLV